MRAWQIKKLKAAGLDPYMRGTWAEAQAKLQALAAAVDTQQMSAVIGVQAEPKARGGKPCPHCGKEFKALHWHVDKCPQRPPEAAA